MWHFLYTCSNSACGRANRFKETIAGIWFCIADQSWNLCNARDDLFVDLIDGLGAIDNEIALGVFGSDL